MILEIFEKVNLVMPIEQRRFFNWFDDTVKELQGMYIDYVIKKDSEYVSPKTLSDDCAVLELYKNAIVDNILFLAGAGEGYKSEFIRKAENAHLKYWNDNARGRRVKRMRW